MKEKVAKFFTTVKSMWDKPLDGRYLNIKEICSFGLYSLGNSWIYNTIQLVITITYIPYFYTIDAIHGYIIYILGSLLNMFFVPLIGQAMEKKRTKWGRYKPYILFSLPILALFTMMAMWSPQYSSETDRVIYAYFSCVPVIAIATFANNMYQTMPNVITPNTQERADIMTPIGLIVGFAPTIMNVIIGPIRSAFMNEEWIAMRIIGAIAVVLGSVCVLFIVKVKERVYELESNNRDLLDAQNADKREAADGKAECATQAEDAQSETQAGMQAEMQAEEPVAENAPVKLSAKERRAARRAARRARREAKRSAPGYLPFTKSMELLFRNKPLWILFAALVVGSLREFWMQFMSLVIQLRFAETASEALNISGIPNTIIGFGVTVSMILLPFATRKLGKNWIIIVFSCLSLAATSVLGFIGLENIPQGSTSAVVITLLFFLARINPTYLLIPVLLGDLADYQQYKTGRRLEGHLQNIIMVIPVLMSFVFMLLAWIWQRSIGFEPSNYSNVDVVSQDLQNIAMTWFNASFLISAASILGMIIILMFYPLGKKKMEAITASLRGASVNMDEMGEGDLNFAEEMAEVSGGAAEDSDEAPDGEGSAGQEADGSSDAECGADKDGSSTCDGGGNATDGKED